MTIFPILSVETEMLIIIVAGALIRKTGLIGEDGKRTVTNLLLYIFLPCNIAYAYLGRDLSIFSELKWVILISICQQLTTFVLTRFLFRGCPDRQRSVLRYAAQFSNCGFIGLTIALSFYGQDGLLYASVFIFPITLLTWTIGLREFVSHTSLRETVRRVALNPSIIAIYFGLVTMLFRIQWPEIVVKTLELVNGGLSPLSMLLVGIVLAGADLRRMFSKGVFVVCLIRLVLMPGLVLLAGLLFRLPYMTVCVASLLTGMPSGSLVAALAVSYDGDELLASNCIVVSTLLSLFTLPVIYLLAQLAA